MGDRLEVSKQAYLIIAHNKFEQLSFLLQLLDHEGADFFLFIDEKSSFSNEVQTLLERSVKKSSLFFVDRHRVYWGAYSQVEAEMTLFRSAFQQGNYQHFHLLSGVDLPLVSGEKS